MLTVNAILAIVGIVFSIIELGLTAYLVSGWWSPSQTQFMLFNSIWSICVLTYVTLGPVYVARIHIPLVAVALEIITAIFWFSGSIAIAVFYRGCGGGVWCGSATAAIIFGFLLWVLFTVMAIIDGLALDKSRRNSTGVKGPNAYPGA